LFLERKKQHKILQICILKIENIIFEEKFVRKEDNVRIQNEETKLHKLLDIELFFFFMDGTFYLGDHLFEWSKYFVKTVRSLGKDFVFLTNNSSQDPESYVQKIKNMGLVSEKIQVFTSGEATAEYIKRYTDYRKLFVLGTPKLKKIFSEYDFSVVNPDRFGEYREKPDAVVLGFDKTLTYESLTVMCDFVRNGLPYIATHPDINCPVENGFIPDAGAMIQAIKASTMREPDIVIGKPNPYILDLLAEKMGIEKEKICMIGDRLYTDIKLGLNSGILSILVLSGETTIDDLEKSDIKPDLVFNNIGEIADRLKK